jgi:signal transduction histidine kinase
MDFRFSPRLLPPDLEWRWTRLMGLIGIAFAAGALLALVRHDDVVIRLSMVAISAIIFAFGFRGRAAHLDKVLRARSAEEERRQRLEALGLATAGLVHELRNALQVLKGFSELAVRAAEEGVDPQRIHDRVAEVDAQASRLLVELQGFLGLTTQDGTTVMRPVGDVVNEVSRLLAPMARMRNISLEAEIDTGLDRRVREPDLRRAVLNLGLNAISYAQKSVRLSVRALDGQTVVTVEDDGAGVPSDQQSLLFTSQTSRRPGGTGLGLVQVRKAAEAEGGTAMHESLTPSGARFVISLPPRPELQIKAAVGT